MKSIKKLILLFTFIYITLGYSQFNNNSVEPTNSTVIHYISGMKSLKITKRVILKLAVHGDICNTLNVHNKIKQETCFICGEEI